MLAVCVRVGVHSGHSIPIPAEAVSQPGVAVLFAVYSTLANLFLCHLLGPPNWTGTAVQNLRVEITLPHPGLPVARPQAAWTCVARPIPTFHQAPQHRNDPSNRQPYSKVRHQAGQVSGQVQGKALWKTGQQGPTKPGNVQNRPKLPD